VVVTQGFFDSIAEHVSGEDVCLLHAGGVTGVDPETGVGEMDDFATRSPGHGEGVCAQFAGLEQTGAHVGAVARGRDADGDIAGCAKRLDLAGKDGFEAVIVADRGESGGIGGEGDRGHTAALTAKASDELGGEMLRVGGTSAVAEPEDFSAVAQGRIHLVRDSFQQWQIGCKLPNHLKMFLERGAKNGGKGSGGSHWLCMRSPATSTLLYRSMSEENRGLRREAIQYVFLDRDGVINRKLAEGRYVTRWEEFELLPGVAGAIAALNRSGRKVIVVTNQRGVALGRMTQAEVESIHDRLRRELVQQTASLDAIYYCPHDRDACECRKPRTGMIQAAFRDFPGAGPENSILIGDSRSDMECGRAAGIATIFIESAALEDRRLDADAALHLADATARSLSDAVQLLL